MAKKNQLTTSDHLPYHEYERLLKSLHSDKEYRWEMYAVVSFCTACRASDVLQIRWEDILDKPAATVIEKKTKKTRRISFNPSAQQKFSQLYQLMGKPDRSEFIFKSSMGNFPMTIQRVNQKLKEFKARYNLKIEHFSTHTFRKTFGRYVYESHNRSAESLVLLNKILRHTSIEITKTYIGITQTEIDGIFNSLQF